MPMMFERASTAHEPWRFFAGSPVAWMMEIFLFIAVDFLEGIPESNRDLDRLPYRPLGVGLVCHLLEDLLLLFGVVHHLVELIVTQPDFSVGVEVEDGELIECLSHYAG